MVSSFVLTQQRIETHELAMLTPRGCTITRKIRADASYVTVWVQSISWYVLVSLKTVDSVNTRNTVGGRAFFFILFVCLYGKNANPCSLRAERDLLSMSVPESALECRRIPPQSVQVLSRIEPIFFSSISQNCVMFRQSRLKPPAFDFIVV